MTTWNVFAAPGSTWVARWPLYSRDGDAASAVGRGVGLGAFWGGVVGHLVMAVGGLVALTAQESLTFLVLMAMVWGAAAAGVGAVVGTVSGLAGSAGAVIAVGIRVPRLALRAVTAAFSAIPSAMIGLSMGTAMAWSVAAAAAVLGFLLAPRVARGPMFGRLPR